MVSAAVAFAPRACGRERKVGAAIVRAATRRLFSTAKRNRRALATMDHGGAVWRGAARTVHAQAWGRRCCALAADLPHAARVSVALGVWWTPQCGHRRRHPSAPRRIARVMERVSLGCALSLDCGAIRCSAARS